MRPIFSLGGPGARVLARDRAGHRADADEHADATHEQVARGHRRGIFGWAVLKQHVDRQEHAARQIPVLIKSGGSATRRTSAKRQTRNGIISEATAFFSAIDFLNNQVSTPLMKRGFVSPP